jgi:hypothetical protein
MSKLAEIKEINERETGPQSQAAVSAVRSTQDKRRKAN